MLRLGAHLAVILLLIGAAHPPVAGEEDDLSLEFRDSYQPIPVVGARHQIKAKPWSFPEKAFVRAYFSMIKGEVPGLYARVTAFWPLRLYRTTVAGDEFTAAEAITYENGMIFSDRAISMAERGLKDTDQHYQSYRLLFTKTVIHELVHLVDWSSGLSETRKWRGLAGERIKRLQEAVRAKTGHSIEKAVQGYQQKDEDSAELTKMVLTEKLPTLYAGTTLIEALAEYAVYTAIMKDPPFPPEVVVFVQEHILSAPTGENTAAKNYAAGMSSLEKNSRFQAIESFGKVLEAAPEFRAVSALRASLLILSRWDDEAVKELGRVIELCKESGIAPEELSAFHAIRGDAYRRLGKHHHSLAEYTAAVAKDPGQLELYSKIAVAKTFAKDYDGAIATLNLAEEKFRQDDRRWMIYLWRGRVWWLKGQRDKAEADFQKARAQVPPQKKDKLEQQIMSIKTAK